MEICSVNCNHWWLNKPMSKTNSCLRERRYPAIGTHQEANIFWKHLRCLYENLNRFVIQVKQFNHSGQSAEQHNHPLQPYSEDQKTSFKHLLA
ncbi:hypothetical protein VP01_1608g1 [Puccinia sorghi]|uniref:Uncharacterized protein n=1 Tax=Puccinia sorghi TaxID=27349 RepID=A0A0L6VHC4_9BASI|nr:hypothetical protein VP01_1608g1 [Puccinia sorghi]